MQTSSEVKALAAAVRRDLDLRPPKEPKNYHSLTLCLIDAVYSIGIRYEPVKRVVERYCQKYGLKIYRDRNAPLPPRSAQDAISDLLARMRALGDVKFAKEVFQHRGRTSPRNGILKATAVRIFGQALADHGVEHLQDVPGALVNESLEQTIRQIPGQRSGISLKYFFMEAGCEDLIKPDRMIQRYVERQLGRPVQLLECQPLLAATVDLLRDQFPHLTPRLLDGRIWAYQREQEKAEPRSGRRCR